MICKNQKGFTLVEILLSIVIIGITVVSVFHIFGTGNLNIFESSRKEDIMFFTSNKMEILYDLDKPIENKNVLSEKLQDELENEKYDLEISNTKEGLYTETSGNIMRVYIEEIEFAERGEGFKVIMVVFSENTSSYVELKSFIRKGVPSG